MRRSAPNLGDLLVEDGLISSAQLEDSLAEQSVTHERLGEILCRRGLLSAGDLLDALSRQLGFRQFDAGQDAIEPVALNLVPFRLAQRHDMLPVNLEEEALVVAMSDPLDMEALDDLNRIAGRIERDLKILIAPPDVLAHAREANYGSIEGNRKVRHLIDKVVDEIDVISTDNEAGDEDRFHQKAEEAGVVNLVDQIIVQAVQERATDIHIEPQENALVIRYRVDGLLYDALTPPHAVYTGAISRIKILADMDIAERRAAQDGRFTHRKNGSEVDIRVSAIPTIHGEKLVLRLLDKTNFDFRLKDLGFSEEDFTAFQTAIHQPFGMVLLSGPTGSGKTTTLYAGLLELRDETLNITTVEDPVEYQMTRINQVQVNTRKQVNFANALRSFLRQDPDVIMVGEIRDQETADIAIRAALTGHMVFSTIHANDAPTTATRLVSMGVEPFMAGSALTMVAAQRLVRRNCKQCLEDYQPKEEVLLAFGDPPPDTGGCQAPRYQRGKGCAVCKGRGFAGRIAIIERMLLTPALRELIAQNQSADEIRRQALAEGMVTLRESGLLKARAGVTTVEEVLRVCLRD